MQVFFATVWSTGAGTRVAVYIRSTQQEALDVANSDVTGNPDLYLGDIGMRYWLLNKNILTAMIAPGQIGLLLDPEYSAAFTSDRNEAENFNVDSDFWQGTDPNDKNQVRARKAAEEILKVERGLGPKGTLPGLTTLNSLWLTYVALNNATGNQAVIGTARSIAKSILDFMITPLSDGTITEAEALQRYQRVVDLNPLFFKL